MSLKKLPVFFSAVLLAASGISHAAVEAAASFEVFPSDVNLKFQRDRQSVIVRITEPTGIQRDVTAQATFTVADPTKAKIEKGVVLPVADGETTLKVEYQGKSIEVLPREFRLLEYLMRNAGHVVTRTMLLEHVWDYHFDPQTNVIDVHVSRLRQKIDKIFERPLLHTVRGAGYCLRAPG